MANNKTEYGFGNDPIVIRKHVDDKKGGVVLNVTGWTDEFIRAGHILIKTTVDGVDIYKPMPVSNGAYAALPQDHVYAGIAVTTVPKEEPFVAMLTIGEVNEKAMPYPVTAAIKTAFKAAVPTIVWDCD